MKTVIVLIIALTAVVTNSFAQLKGSGKIITKTYDFKNFDKVYFNDLDGKLEVEIGKPWSITVAIDDNLLPLLAFKEEQSEYALTIFFTGNKNNNKYIEDTHLKIKITMPEASVIGHNGNSNLSVLNVVGRYFRIENSSNATATISGSIDELDVKNSGNGMVNAENLIAKKAKVKSTGNGNTKVNVTTTIEATVNGNGSVTNKGKAKFDTRSTQSGNGKLINL